MNVGELRKALEGLPDNMRVDAFTTGDREFPVRLATVYERLPMVSARVLLQDDPNEFEPKHERLLHADEIEGEG